MSVGYNRPLYILPFDHRGSFQTGLFGWRGTLNAEQTDHISAAKQVVYDGFKAALAAGVPKDRAGILVDEQFGAAILADAANAGIITSAPAEKSGQDEFDFEYGADCGARFHRLRRRSDELLGAAGGLARRTAIGRASSQSDCEQVLHVGRHVREGENVSRL